MRRALGIGVAGWALACGGGDVVAPEVAPAGGLVDVSTLGGDWKQIERRPWGWVQTRMGGVQCPGGDTEVTFDVAASTLRMAGGDNFQLGWRSVGVDGGETTLQTDNLDDPSAHFEVGIRPGEPPGAITVTLAGVTRTFGREGAFPRQWTYCGGSPALDSLVGSWRALDPAKACTTAGRLVVLDEGRRFEFDGVAFAQDAVRYDVDDAGVATYVMGHGDGGEASELRLAVPADDERILEVTRAGQKARYVRDGALGDLGPC